MHLLRYVSFRSVPAVIKLLSHIMYGFLLASFALMFDEGLSGILTRNQQPVTNLVAVLMVMQIMSYVIWKITDAIVNQGFKLSEIITAFALAISYIIGATNVGGRFNTSGALFTFALCLVVLTIFKQIYKQIKPFYIRQHYFTREAEYIMLAKFEDEDEYPTLNELTHSLIKHSLRGHYVISSYDIMQHRNSMYEYLTYSFTVRPKGWLSWLETHAHFNYSSRIHFDKAKQVANDEFAEYEELLGQTTETPVVYGPQPVDPTWEPKLVTDEPGDASPSEIQNVIDELSTIEPVEVDDAQESETKPVIEEHNPQEEHDSQEVVEEHVEEPAVEEHVPQEVIGPKHVEPDWKPQLPVKSKKKKKRKKRNKRKK